MRKMDLPSRSLRQGLGAALGELLLSPGLAGRSSFLSPQRRKRTPLHFGGNVAWLLFLVSLQVLIVKSILMTVQVTRVSTESVWMELTATAVSAPQGSQVMPFVVGGPTYSPVTW